MAILFCVMLAVFVVSAGVYNTCIRKQQLVEEAWSGIDVQLKRRHNLIPNLVEVVKGYAQHEKSVLEDVTRLRTESLSQQGSIQEKASFENNLTKGLRSVFALAEAYPDLKANQQFLDLQKNLVEIEDEIQLARRYYNGTVRDLNVLVRSFPPNLIARMFHFSGAEFFEIDTVTQRDSPEVRI